MRDRPIGGIVGTMSGRVSEQRGQTTAEYLGGLLIVSVVIAALSLTPIGTAIERRAHELVCLIGGLSCPQDPPLSQCVVSEQSASVSVNGNLDVRIVNIELEGGIEYIRQLRANGEVAITVKLPLSGAVGPALKKALGLGAELDAHVGSGTTPAVTFVLDDAAAADKFERQLTDATIAIAAGPIGARILGKKIDIDIPPVESVAFEYTHGGDVSIGTEGPGGYGDGSLELGNALGIKKNLTEGKPNSGDLTAYYRIEGGLAGEAGLMLGQQAGGGLAGDVVMAVVFDASGKPKGLQVIATGSYEGRFQYGGRFRDLQSALDGLQGLDIKANVGEGQKLQLQLDLDLSDADVTNALLEFVQGVNPITGDPGNTAAAAAELGQALLDNGKAQIRTYDTSSTNGGAGIDLGVGGAGIDINTAGSDLTGAYDFVPGQGFLPSQTCVRN
jgi:hypothetical protein